MTRRYLLDTNIAIYLIRQSFPALLTRARSHQAEVAISSITEAELRFGMALQPAAVERNAAIAAFLDSIEIVDWTSHCAGAYAQLAAQQQVAGVTMSAMDLLITAHAMALGLTLVTHDRLLLQVRGVISEDWTVPA